MNCAETLGQHPILSDTDFLIKSFSPRNFSKVFFVKDF